MGRQRLNPSAFGRIVLGPALLLGATLAAASDASEDTVREALVQLSPGGPSGSTPARTTSPWSWEWTWVDTTLELTYASVQFIDWMQTRYFLQNPVQRVGPYTVIHREGNPILGPNPSRAELAVWNIAALAAHAAIARALPNPLRRIWQVAWIGIEGGVVAHNASVYGGFHLDLP